MATVSGSCVISKVSGLLQIREDTAPLKLMWKAIDKDASLEIPLNRLLRLQLSPDLLPKMLLKLYYTVGSDAKDVRLVFNNRGTMNKVRETLQTIVARQKTVIKDAPAPAPQTPQTPQPHAPLPSPDPLDFSAPESLLDARLLKNFKLQQKMLSEDKALRNFFANSVMKYKFSPVMFWLSRLSQLRTYALALSQKKGPYNVLSTIKPVATSDNKVNVNVTRDTIGEMFSTYPVIQQAFADLVPAKISEGEFWLRFFNSRLFRRLRGDRINNSNTRGDVIIDAYLETEPAAKRHRADGVSRVIDLEGNAEHHPQRLGVLPDFTMKFSETEAVKEPANVLERPKRQPNEMVLLMRNMNRLSSKMVHMLEHDAAAAPDLADLHDVEEPLYVPLKWDTAARRYAAQHARTHTAPPASAADLARFASAAVCGGPDLNDTYVGKAHDISSAASGVTALVKYNFRAFKTGPRDGVRVLTEAQVLELHTLNTTVVEFLMHFWSKLADGHSAHLQKLYENLQRCRSDLAALTKRLAAHIQDFEAVRANERLGEKLLKDLARCVEPMALGLERACSHTELAAKS